MEHKNAGWGEEKMRGEEREGAEAEEREGKWAGEVGSDNPTLQGTSARPGFLVVGCMQQLPAGLSPFLEISHSSPLHPNILQPRVPSAEMHWSLSPGRSWKSGVHLFPAGSGSV